MKKFYIIKNEIQEGAFSVEELKSLNIKNDTPIWYEGIENWTTAEKVEELKFLLKVNPPEFTKEKKQENFSENSIKTENKYTKYFFWSGLAIFTIILISVFGLEILPLVLIPIGIYFLWKNIGGLKVYSIISLLISIAGTIGGIGLVFAVNTADENIDGEMRQAMSMIGVALSALSIYFIAYSITVIASVKKNELN